MRLFLAVAVLMLALVAYAEAQDEPTIEQRFNEFRDRMTEIGTNLAEGAKTTYERVQNSDFVVKSKAALSDIWERMKSSVTDGSN